LSKYHYLVNNSYFHDIIKYLTLNGVFYLLVSLSAYIYYNNTQSQQSECTAFSWSRPGWPFH